MPKTTQKTSKQLLTRIYRNPRYGGRHIVIFDGKIYTAKSGRAASELLGRLLKTHPTKTPVVTYIPKADSLILFSP